MADLTFLSDELDRLRTEGLYNTIRHLDGPQGAWIVVDGSNVLYWDRETPRIESVREIVNIQIGLLAERLEEQNLSIEVTDAARDLVAAEIRSITKPR